MSLRRSGEWFRVAGFTALVVAMTLPGVSQTAPAAAASGQSASASTGTQADGNAPASTRRPSRRSRRRYVSPATGTQPASSQAGAPDAAQRTRDAQILAAQKAQSAEIARQNAITTGNVVKERAAQQAEQRIQDAPGPGSQPLAGDPAIQPKAGASDPQGIQDAPGPAQTLPQAPPPQTTAPAPQPTTPPNY